MQINIPDWLITTMGVVWLAVITGQIIESDGVADKVLLSVLYAMLGIVAVIDLRNRFRKKEA